MKNHQEEAVELFRSGYNCAQSVLSVFAEELGMDVKNLSSLSAGFGGGMGKMQETCGAVTGAFMLFGIYGGRVCDDHLEAKEKSNELVLAFAEKFKKERGSIQCRELLGADMHTEEGKEEIEKKNLFGTVCEECIILSVGIIDELIRR